MANRPEYSQRKTFTRVTANMTPEQQARVINENFDLLRNIFTSWVVYDEDNPRILIGKGPDENYGVFVSKVGEDVIKSLEPDS